MVLHKEEKPDSNCRASDSNNQQMHHGTLSIRKSLHKTGDNGQQNHFQTCVGESGHAVVVPAFLVKLYLRQSVQESCGKIEEVEQTRGNDVV
jgi:hypothetical protein